MSLVHLKNVRDLVAPTVVVALDAWVDAGVSLHDRGQCAGRRRLARSPRRSTRTSCTTTARAGQRSRSWTAGPPNLSWPDLSLRRARIGERDVLVLTGPEPDFRWRELADDLALFARQMEVEQWISLGAIPAAVPHTRPVPVLGTESSPGLLRGDIAPGPQGLLRVPSAAISVFDVAVAEAGVPALGYYAQIPHYISGDYAPAAVALVEALARHLDVEIDVADLRSESETLRTRLDTATAVDEKTRTYVERLEEMVDESRLPEGDELISEIERFLRDRGNEPGHGQIH